MNLTVQCVVNLSCIGPKPGKWAASEWMLVIENFHSRMIFTLIINHRRKRGVLFHGEIFHHLMRMLFYKEAHKNELNFL